MWFLCEIFPKLNCLGNLCHVTGCTLELVQLQSIIKLLYLAWQEKRYMQPSTQTLLSTDTTNQGKNTVTDNGSLFRDKPVNTTHAIVVIFAMLRRLTNCRIINLIIIIKTAQQLWISCLRSCFSFIFNASSPDYVACSTSRLLTKTRAVTARKPP